MKINITDFGVAPALLLLVTSAQATPNQVSVMSLFPGNRRISLPEVQLL